MNLRLQNLKGSLSIRELTIFAMLGGLMFASKKIMEVFPNVHLLGLFIVSLTVVFRWKALYPIYLYVILDGIFGGFNIWWVPYLYIWTVLWGGVMLLPGKMPTKVQMIVYPVISCLHGLSFGILYSPAQAFFFHLDFSSTVAWILSGFSFDLIHGISNLISGFLIVPLILLLRKCMKNPHRTIE